MIRMIAALAVSAVALTGAAYAQANAAWTAPDQSFSLSRPGNWPVDRMSDSSPAIAHYAAGLADAECSIYAIQRPNTATVSPGTVQRSFATPFTAEQWTQVASGIRSLGAAVTAETMSVNTDNFWPVQRARLTTSDGPVEAGIQARPGIEIWTFCQSFDSRDRVATFDSIIRSIATPRDAELQAAAVAAAAEAAAPPPPPEPPPPPSRGRRN